MLKMNKILCMLLVLCTIVSMALPAMAAEVPEGTETASSDEVVAVMGEPKGDGVVSEENDTYAYPLIFMDEDASDLTVYEGEIATLKFTIYPDYSIECYNVEIYNSYGTKIGTASDFLYNSSTRSRKLTITVDTADLDMGPGKYTIKYYMEYYSGGSWYSAPYYYTKTLTVLEDVCKGNHNLVEDYVVYESTCEEEGSVKYSCTRCDYYEYRDLPLADHIMDDGYVSWEPTDYEEGIRIYTCTVCGLEVETPIPALKPAPEKPYKIANVVSGVHVYWTGKEGVNKYGLWRSETGKNGTYKWIANPTVPHFTDTKVETGKTYFYKVTYLNTDYNVHSDQSEPIGVVYVSTPDITNRFNKPEGVSLSWSKSWGATGYAIYRKPYSGNSDWKRVATISGNTTFTWIDTSVKDNNGVAYKYTVRALGGADMKTLSGCRNAGRSMVRLTPRVLTSAEKKSVNSIKCTWTTSSAVTGYEIRFMVRDEIYKTFTIGNYKTGAKTFGDLPTGVTYKIQVRSYVKIDGMGFYSPWSAAKKVYMP